jgi:hypothetical protein
MVYPDWLNGIYMQGLKDWKPRAKSFDVEAELNHFVEKMGYRLLEILIHYRQRLGEKK